MSIVIVASFAYLMHWISGQETARALEPPVVNSPPNTANTSAGSGKEGGVNPPAAGQPVNGASGAPDGTTGVPAPGAGTVNGVAGETGTTGSNQANPAVKLSFVGDVMFASKVEDLLKKHGWDYPYHYVKDYLDKADITVANLETPVSKRGAPQSKEYVYRSSPDALPAFKSAGFDLVNTSNNHILDYGQAALLDTMDELDKIGIKRVGTGRNSEEAYRHVIIEQNGIKVAFLGFSRVVPETSWYAGKQKPGLAETYTTKLPLEAISKAREEADLVIVLAHWGVERKDRPVKEQTDLAHKYIDQGADLVVASHPHVLQGFEQYKGKWIAYSLGNFIFTTNTEPVTWESMILNATCTKDRSCDLQMIPMLTKGAQPIRMTEEDGAKLFDKMTRISVNARLDQDGKVIQAPPAAPAAGASTPAKPSSTAPKKTEGAATGTTGTKPAGSQTTKTAPAQTTNKPASDTAAKRNEQAPPKSGTKTETETETPKKQP